MNKYLIFLIAFFSGLLGVFAFAPFDCWPLAYISLLGLLWVAKQTQKSVAFIGAFVWSMGFFCFGVSWLNVSIHQFEPLSLVIRLFNSTFSDS